MASTVTFRLDRRGVGEILRSREVGAWTADVAQGLADEIESATDYRPEVHSFTTDRAGTSVSVPAKLQASDGALTRAAAARGLTVRPL
ncbi:hypothetical protein ACTD5D_39785 [Nocardia takedensis]|uniref:hypothetical protein n=1 Tax=Nocardia takedensis TaxID=259390 RepID=UPI003F762B24